jgi:hypothetical protein
MFAGDTLLGDSYNILPYLECLVYELRFDASR